MAKNTWFIFLLALFTPFISDGALGTPILQINGDGRLFGALDVDVDGTNYDVQFNNDSCVNIFSGCDEASDFLFQTIGLANSASDALLSQVLR